MLGVVGEQRVGEVEHLVDARYAPGPIVVRRRTRWVLGARGDGTVGRLTPARRQRDAPASCDGGGANRSPSAVERQVLLLHRS